MGHDEKQDLTPSRQDQLNFVILKALLNNPVSGMICVKDLQGKVVLANTAMLQMLARSELEVIGKDDLDDLSDPEQVREIRANDRRVLEEGLTIQKEELVVMGNRRRSCVFTKSPLKDADGRVIGILGIGIDITDRKEAETRLRASEERFRLAFENARDAIFWADADTGELVNCNLAAESLVGRPRDEIIGQSQTFLHPSEEVNHQAEVFRGYIQSGANGLVELDVIRKDGSRVPVEISGAITEVAGQRIAQGIFRDVTDRQQHNAELVAQSVELRRMQESLAESRDKYVDLYDFAPVGYFTLSRKGHVLEANLAGEGLVGMDRTQLSGLGLGRFVAEEDLGRWDQFLLGVLRSAQHQTCELMLQRVDGSTFYGLLEGVRLDGPAAGAPPAAPAMRVTMSDVTKRKRAEQALAASERKYRLLHETMTDAFVLVGMDGRIREFNKAYQNMLGYEAQEVHRLTYVDITPPQWHDFEAEIVRTQILPRGYSDVYTKEYRRKNGKVFPVELRTFLLRDQTGTPEGMWAIVRDITERQAAVALIRKSREDLEARVQERTVELSQTVAALRESEQRYRQLFDTVPDAVWAFDLETGLCVDMNRAAERMFGYTASEARTVNVLDVSAEPERTKADLPRIAAEGRIVSIPLRQCRRKDGTVFPAEASIGMFEIAGRRVVCGVFRDITERLQAQTHLAESRDRLRSVLASMDDLLFVYDKEGRFIDYYCQPDKLDRLYAPPEQFLGKHYRDVLPAAVAGQLDGAIEALHQSGKGQQIEYALEVAGRQQWFNAKASLWKDAGDEAGGMTMVVRDVTERVLAEQAFQKSEEDLRAILSSLHETAIAVYDTDGNIRNVWIAPELLAKYGLKLEGVIGKTLWDIHPPEIAQARIARIREVTATGRGVTDEYLTHYPRGSYWMETTLSPMHGPAEKSKVVAFIRDVTDRVRAEHELRASEARYRALFEQSPVAMWELDFSPLRPYIAGLRAQGVQDLRQYFRENPDAENALIASTRAVAVNQAAVRMHEAASKEELLAPSASYAPEYRRHMVEARIALAEGRRALQAQIKGKTFKDRAMEGLAEYCVLPGHEEGLDRVLAVVIDVTAIHEAQNRLRVSEARFRGLFEQSPVAMAELDLSGFQQGLGKLRRRGVKDLRKYLGKHPDVLAALLGKTRIIAVNDALVRLHGTTTTEELIAKYAQLRDTETTAALMAARLALAEGANAVQVTSPLYTADGRKIRVIMDYLLLPGSEETWDRAVLAITDVTAIQEVQGRLRESEERFRGMFEQSPVAMWELDFTPLRPYIAGLRARGVQDLRQHFRDNPGEVNDLLAAGQVLAINQATVQMEGVATKEEVLTHTGPDAPETRAHMVESRIALAEGQTAIQIQQRGYTTSGKTMEGILNYLVLPGHEESLDRVLVTITDVTTIREAQTALQEAHRKLMTAVEDERRRLAAELHDSVAQDLVALELSLRNSAGGLVKKPAVPEEAAKVLQSAVGSTNRVVEEIREICHGLYPPALETFGLGPSLKQLAAKCTGAGLPARLRVAPAAGGRRFGAAIEIAVYRIAQEAVNNALRHSKAKKLSMSLEMEEGKVVLSVADNGKGFIPDRQPASSLGLVSMRERAKAVGGELQIDSHKKGTTVTLYVPVGPA